MTNRLPLLTAGLLVAATVAAQGPSPLQKLIKDEEVHRAWVYNDLGAGFAEAKKTGKPLLVVFR
jgi:hypothetical protein